MYDEFVKYQEAHFPKWEIDTEYTMMGPVCLRFNLGWGQENSEAREVQMLERAMSLVKMIFSESENIFVVMHDYFEEGNPLSSYLYEQLQLTDTSKFYLQERNLVTSYLDQDTGAPRIEKGRLLVALLNFDEINFENICRHKGYYDFAPRIKFIESSTHILFEMYDDRGCYVRAKDEDSLREIENKYGAWLTDREKVSFSS